MLSLSYGAAQEVVLFGVVKDYDNNIPLNSVKVAIPEINKGTFTDEKGQFKLALPKGIYEVSFRMLGYNEITKTISLTSDTEIEVIIQKEDQLQEFSEVVILGEGNDANVRANDIGTIRLDIEEIKTLPAFMGEVDVIKTLQLMPGVQSAAEGAQGFYVRGGGPDQNLVLIDGTHVYNASHLFGFFSVFNVDAVKNVSLTKVGMPAQYGGRLSSVLDVNMREGSSERFGMSGGIGLISSRLTAEGPIDDGKGSFIVSGRRTYIDVITKPFIPADGNFSGTGYFFYDLNTKLNYKISERDRLIFNGYIGKDNFVFSTNSDDFSVDMPWGNAVFSTQWNRLISDKLVMNVRASLTDYNFQFLTSQDDFNFGLNSGIRDYGGSVGFTYLPNSRHKMKFGMEYINHVFTPISVSAEQGDVNFDVGEAQQLFSHETAIYFSDAIEITEKFKLEAGLRYSMFHHLGPFIRFNDETVGVQDDKTVYESGELIDFFNFLEPRLTARYLINKKSSFKIGWNYNAQYIHLANLSAVALPTDIWYPATSKVPPQNGWQVAGGYFRNFMDNMFEASVEVYYKSMNNLVEFREGALPQDNAQDNTDNLLTTGAGYSYGAEFFIKKALGKLTGWIGYTWSKTDRIFPDINEGNVFPAKYDRRHDLTAVVNYKFSDRWTFAASFVYATGNTMTLPTSWYLQDGDVLYEFGERNANRLPSFHRLDVSATWYDRPTKTITDAVTGEQKKIKKRFRHNVNISVYNVYNRQNPFFLFVQNNGSLAENNFNISLQQVSLFPILPSVTWNFKF